MQDLTPNPRKSRGTDYMPSYHWRWEVAFGTYNTIFHSECKSRSIVELVPFTGVWLELQLTAEVLQHNTKGKIVKIMDISAKQLWYVYHYKIWLPIHVSQDERTKCHHTNEGEKLLSEYITLSFTMNASQDHIVELVPYATVWLELQLTAKIW